MGGVKVKSKINKNRRPEKKAEKPPKDVPKKRTTRRNSEKKTTGNPIKKKRGRPKRSKRKKKGKGPKWGNYKEEFREIEGTSSLRKKKKQAKHADPGEETIPPSSDEIKKE